MPQDGFTSFRSQAQNGAVVYPEDNYPVHTMANEMESAFDESRWDPAAQPDGPAGVTSASLAAPVARASAMAAAYEDPAMIAGVTSTESKVVEWPWSGSERNHIYIDFVVYLILLIVFSVITLRTATYQSYDAYHLVQSVQQTLMEEFRPEPEVTFHEIRELAGMRRWLRGQFFFVTYGFNPNDPEEEDASQPASYISGFYLSSTTILGPIRLRQLRVNNHSCKVDRAWESIADGCFGRYSDGRVRQNDSFNQTWPRSQAEVASSMEKLVELKETRCRSESRCKDPLSIAMAGFSFNNRTGAGYYRGRLETVYRDDGFVVALPEGDEKVTSDVLKFLEASQWLDAATRALFIEFTLYLSSTNILLPVRLVVEFHPAGTTWTDASLEPINLNTYSFDAGGQMVLFIVGIIVATCTVVWDLYSVLRMRLYSTTGGGTNILWSLIVACCYLGICVASALRIYNMKEVANLTFVWGKYFATHKLGYLVSIERGLWAITSFIVWFRLLKFTSQLPSLGLLGRTISNALPQVAAFFLISCVIFLAFAQCFFMAYFASVPGFQSYHASIMSVLRFTVQDFDYRALSEENRILTPVLFALLLIIVFFIWVNVMVAIISDVYQTEREVGTLSWDDDFEQMTSHVRQPENDFGAMMQHTPIRATPNELPSPVALNPEQFWRVRFNHLERYVNLMTVDMHAHFSALAAHVQTTAVANYDSADQTKLMHVALDELVAEDLEQHLGIYARMGMIKQRGQRRADHELLYSRRPRPMDLQALYFDRRLHNITSAQLWWDRHKFMFDAREQLMHYVKWRSRKIMGNISSRIHAFWKRHGYRQPLTYLPPKSPAESELHVRAPEDTA